MKKELSFNLFNFFFVILLKSSVVILSPPRDTHISFVHIFGEFIRDTNIEQKNTPLPEFNTISLVQNKRTVL